MKYLTNYLVLKPEYKDLSRVFSVYLLDVVVDNLVLLESMLKKHKYLKEYFKVCDIEKVIDSNLFIGTDNILYDISQNSGIPVDAFYILKQLEDNYLTVNSLDIGGMKLSREDITKIFTFYDY